MSDTVRDNFTKNTKEILAKRVAFCCSNPVCPNTTMGPHSDKDDYINIGVAAHIKAAAPGGKRYDPNMTKKERKDISNGIWLCQNCAKLIDSDEEKYTVELLSHWKEIAERKAAKKIAVQIEAESSLIDKVNREYLDTNKEEGTVLNKLDRLIEQIPRLKKDFQLLKFEIEHCDYSEAVNGIESLHGVNDEIKEIRIWLNYVIGNYDKVLEEVDGSKKNSEFILKIAGKSDLVLGNYDDAITKFSKANELQETYENYFLILKCYESMDNNEGREGVLQKLLRFSYNKDITNYEWGCFTMYSKKSLEYFSEAIKNNREFAEAYLKRGIVERFYGEWGKAIADLETYIEIGGDYTNTDILLELAMAYYNNGDFNNIYISRWIDNMMNSSARISLENGKSALVVDIGYDYSNIMNLTRKGDYILVNINGIDIMKVSFKNRAKSGIGLYPSQVNEFLLLYGSDMSEEEIKEAASLPALYRIFDNDNEYEAVKRDLLSENVLHINHKEENYEEYIIEDENICVDIEKRIKSLNAIIKIGDYIIDEWFSVTAEGFHTFRSKLSQGTMFQEAVIILIGPKQECQLTFKKDRINIIDK